MTQVESDSDSPAAYVAAQLQSGGLTLPVAFVGDVLREVLDVVARHPELDQPAERHALVARVASAVYEDEAVVGRVIDQVYVDAGGSLWRDPVPEPVDDVEEVEEVEDEEDDEDDRGYDPRDVAAAVAERLTAQNTPLSVHDVISVMRALVDLTGHGDPPEEPAMRREAVAGIARVTGQPADAVGRILDAVRDEVDAETDEDDQDEDDEPEEDENEDTVEQKPDDLAQRTAVTTAVAERLRSLGVPATPVDVGVVMDALAAQTGSPEPPADPAQRSEVLTRVATAAGRPVDLVTLIVDEVGRTRRA